MAVSAQTSKSGGTQKQDGKGNNKTVTKNFFSVERPFPETVWPDVSSSDQATILELLCSILRPIGEHRSHHRLPSKGKRAKKRKRAGTEKTLIQDTTPPRPELEGYLKIGFNSNLRWLQDDAGNSRMLPEDTPRSNEPNSPELAVIFVDKASVSELLWQRLPPLIHAHDARTQSDPKTRLVSLPKGAEARMSEALGIPRVSILGLPRGVPGAERLLRLCEKVVEPVVIQGLSDIQAGRYFPVSISVETKEVSVIKKTPKPDIKAKA